jgi:F0F1-type ATP synthase membrane subunit c/vacuolar-type H+-ATPase subunit K
VIICGGVMISSAFEDFGNIVVKWKKQVARNRRLNSVFSMMIILILHVIYYY